MRSRKKFVVVVSSCILASVVLYFLNSTAFRNFVWPRPAEAKYRLDPIEASKKGILPNVYCSYNFHISAQQCGDFFDRIQANPVLKERLLLGKKHGVKIHVETRFVITDHALLIVDVDSSDQKIIDFLSGIF